MGRKLYSSGSDHTVKIDDPNITMEEYIRLEEEKARRRGKMYNWETATYGKIWDNEDVHDLGSVETEFPAIVFNDTLTSEAALSCEPTVSSVNNEIDFRISFSESDDEDYTPTVSCLNDLDFFKDFEKEFSAIVYNDALTSKLDFLTEPTDLNERNIDEYWWRLYKIWKSQSVRVLKSQDGCSVRHNVTKLGSKKNFKKLDPLMLLETHDIVLDLQESKVVLGKAVDVDLVVMDSSWTDSGKQDTSISSGTYITHVVDADIRPVNDQVPSAEVHLTAQHNVLANEQQHTDQSEPSYDTYLLEKVDSNTTPDSTNMSHRGGEIDQDAEQDQVKSPLLKAEFLKTNDMVEKEVYNELSNRFLQLEKHCISLKISMQQKEESFQSNKPCKNQESPEFREFFEINDLKAQLQAKTTLICNLKNQIKSVKDASNEAKVKNDIDVIETINIELEHSVAKLLAANEQLHKENEHLKQTYKELYDLIKKTHIQNKDDKYVLAKPHHVIAPGSSRNSQEESYGSNDMAHNHYLEKARKKTQERNRSSKPSVMSSVRLQNTANGKLFDSCTSKVDNEPPNGSNEDITNPYECEETLNVSAGLTLQRQMESADNTSDPAPHRKERCTLQCALSLKEEKSSYLRAVISTTSISPHALVVQEPVVSTGTPSSTRIDQDTPSTSTSKTIQEAQSHVIPTSVKEDNHGIEGVLMDNDL
ncbi:hypothetical protein Tco_1124758 [Tanacetum coccineum]|uniref:Uncharacterized protein n=1 Tax=Tanacetum coccineum TaxID=301880 RepID=A0ABQ5JA22_9ASTR